MRIEEQVSYAMYLLKRGFSSNQTMVVLITNVEDFPKRSDIVKEVLKKHSDVKNNRSKI